jgi:hypothetical protein
VYLELKLLQKEHCGEELDGSISEVDETRSRAAVFNDKTARVDSSTSALRYIFY